MMMPLKYRNLHQQNKEIYVAEFFKFLFAMFLCDTRSQPYVHSLMVEGCRATSANLMKLFIHIKHWHKPEYKRSKKV